MDYDLTEQLAVRDRMLKRLALQSTPEERLHLMAGLQRRAWETLRKSPAGYAHFLARNFKARAIPIREAHAP